MADDTAPPLFARGFRASNGGAGSDLIDAAWREQADDQDEWAGTVVPHPESPRQAAYAAVWALVEGWGASAEDNARTWRAVHAALDAAQVSAMPREKS